MDRPLFPMKRLLLKLCTYTNNKCVVCKHFCVCECVCVIMPDLEQYYAPDETETKSYPSCKYYKNIIIIIIIIFSASSSAKSYQSFSSIFHYTQPIKSIANTMQFFEKKKKSSPLFQLTKKLRILNKCKKKYFNIHSGDIKATAAAPPSTTPTAQNIEINIAPLKRSMLSTI